MNNLEAALPELDSTKEGAGEGSGAADDAPADVSLASLLVLRTLLLSHFDTLGRLQSRNGLLSN
jgi:hypothetical protein